MPDVRAAGPQGGAATEVVRREGTGLGAPGLAHPMLAPLEWSEAARLRTPLHWAVLNVAHGPGVRPDAYCLDAAGALRARGTAVLGHLQLHGGRRPYAELLADALRFRDWYGVRGFYLAQCPSGREALDATRRLTGALRGLFGDGGHLVADHGTHPHPGYARCADQLVTFRGAWRDYRWSQVAEWTAELPAHRFCHVVHGLPATRLEEALRVARWHGAGTVWFTDRTDRTARGGTDPCAGLPDFWDEVVSLLGPAVSE